jgi:hypothetical protein
VHKAWWLVAVLLLSGCAAPDSAPIQEPDVAVVTDPLDVQASAAGSHVHDYWQGRQQLTAVKASTSTSLNFGTGDHDVKAIFRPTDGTIIPQGTGRLEATLSWRDSDASVPGVTSLYNRVDLWARSAADSEAIPVAEVTNGETVAWTVGNAQADPPHYVVSLWEFHAVFWNEGGDENRFSGSITLHVEAYRTLPLEVFPPHPDRWDGATELLLHEDSGTVRHVHAATASNCAPCLPSFGLSNGTVVPHDAREVVVEFLPGADATPTPVRFLVHGADTRSHTVVEGQPSGAGWRYSIPVVPGRGDSPYALQSLWSFDFDLATPESQGAWIGGYQVSVRALR